MTATVSAAALALFIIGASGGSFSGSRSAGSSEARAQPSSSGADISEAQRRATVIDYQDLDRRLQQLAADQSMVGLAVGIIEDGDIRFLKGYGETIAGSGDPVTVDTVFRWASLSKGVAGDMVAKLAAERRLSLYEPIAKYSATLRLPAGNEHRATISDVLSHRLGIYSHAHESKLEDGVDPKYLRADLATLNAICAPGQCHAYQNVAFDAATEVVERVTGQPYRQVVRERLFLPLGMASASMTLAELQQAKSWARPHRGGKNSKPVEVTEPYYRVPAAGGVNGSIKDLAIWLRAQLGSEPEVLPPAVLQDVQSPRVATPGELGRLRKFRERIDKATYGLGWRIYDYSGHRVVGHRGGVTGYRSLIMFDPQLKSGVVALWNSSTSQPGGLEFEVMDMLYKLPRRDWLALGDGPAGPGEVPTAA